MVFWLKLPFPWRYGLLLRTGWGSNPSADGYGPRWPGSGPAIAGCRETGNRGKRVRAAAEAFKLVLSSFARMRGAGEGRRVLDGLAHLQAGTGARGCGALFSSALPA